MQAERTASQIAQRRDNESDRPRYAKLPEAPITTSPVPRLTSLYHFDAAGEYGDRKYPGNCGGILIRDLLLYFQPATVFDPMSGSGTCRHVCADLGINCVSGDIHGGFDACNAARWPTTKFDFIWAHPPYWRQKLYADDPRDLSRAPTLDGFLQRYAAFVQNCAAALNPRGVLAILMGDYTDRQAGFLPLTYHTKRLAFDAGLRQACPDIVRFGHGASSNGKVYRSSFIPNLHDVCALFNVSDSLVAATPPSL